MKLAVWMNGRASFATAFSSSINLCSVIYLGPRQLATCTSFRFWGWSTRVQKGQPRPQTSTNNVLGGLTIILRIALCVELLSIMRLNAGNDSNNYREITSGKISKTLWIDRHRHRYLIASGWCSELWPYKLSLIKAEIPSLRLVLPNDVTSPVSVCVWVEQLVSSNIMTLYEPWTQSHETWLSHWFCMS